MYTKVVPLVIYIVVSILIIVAGYTPLNSVTQPEYEVWKHMMLTWFVTLPVLASVVVTIKLFQKEKTNDLNAR
ncbi:hypothetical protein [Pseudomonas phage vB_PseuGesM_254]|uniref:Uncharacterized protein n=1 Tax=Pseudomonas phage vB_PseuGesM_254 TaxID=3092638 RepID=A0AAX4G7T0_9CAUD|nr:hypothetical protein [Pseudomonas phage PseuGes_254]